MVTVKQVVITS